MSLTSEVIDWQGITLSVGYTPKRFGDSHHIEIRVLNPKGAVIPVTDTGYRSHFFYEEVAPYGGAGGYVRAWLDRAADTTEWKRQEANARQYRLF